MSLKALNQFQKFDLDGFLEGKRLLYVKAEIWDERDESGNVINLLGSKVTGLIAGDSTDYGRDVSNFGEHLTIKVRGVAPDGFSKFKPLATEVGITDVEKSTIWGEFRNQLSITAKVVAKS